MQLEVRRKDLENEVESKKEQIRKYSQQQLETKKNEEYQALTREIEHVRQSISELEDQELELMEEQDDFKAKLAEASQVAEEAKVNEAQLLSELDEREKNLGSQLDQLDEEREALADAIDPKALAHYERLLDTKGGRVIVGIDHGSCGGCHMKLQAQEIVNAKSERERITCTNCGRLLYYTREMVLANELED